MSNDRRTDGQSATYGNPATITARFAYELFRNFTIQVVDIDGKREKRIHGLDQWTTIAFAGIGASPLAYKAGPQKFRRGMSEMCRG